MKPKEKCDELVDKFKDFVDYEGDDCFTEQEKMTINAKQCALICVNEILDNCENIFDAEYWKEVETEIEKL
jgi:hypothetical protein